jgi:hypothetical protein
MIGKFGDECVSFLLNQEKEFQHNKLNTEITKIILVSICLVFCPYLGSNKVDDLMLYKNLDVNSK